MTASLSDARPAFPLAVVSLHSDAGVTWTVEPTSPLPAAWRGIGERPVPATVPGEVHVDLLAAALIPDPFDADAETRLAWIGSTSWTYRASFDWGGEQQSRHDLVAEGLDTVATITLNGQEVARTANQHRSYRFDVSELLVAGHNELEISFAAPVIEAQVRSSELGDRPRAYGHPFNAIRKMAAGYGWDWGPDVAGVGIWKPIRIETWTGVRLSAVRPLARLEHTDGVLQAHVDLEWLSSAEADVQVTVRVAGAERTQRVTPGETSVALVVAVPDVSAWWPRGYGDQPLYPVEVELTRGGQIQDAWHGRVGFRNVTLSTAPDEQGSEFVLSVNDQPVFVKGANWIPDDAFLTRLNRDTYARSITDATEAGINLLRVWGGGIYESKEFYDVCDQLGVLVWQDFLLACAAYSEDEPLWSEIEAEARQAVTRLAQHASLAVWNGGNENIWGFVEWNWRTSLAGRSWGDGYYTKLFPSIVAELDPRTPYSPGSPFSYAKYHHPNDYRHGTIHLWEVWNRQDYRHYRDQTARFVSEFGFQGPPAWSTLTSVVHDEPLDPYGYQMLVHQKAEDGNLKLQRGLGGHLPMWPTEPEVDMADWHWTTQLNQARAVTYGIEHYRSHYPLNRGTVVWQLNDNWPVVSWAAVDGHGIRKPLWYALRAVYRERFVTIQPRPEEPAPQAPGGQEATERPTVLLHNDSDTAWSGLLTLSRRNSFGTGDALAEQQVRFHVDARSALAIRIDDDVLDASHPTQEYLVAEADDTVAGYWYFVEDTELVLALPQDCLQVTVEPNAAGYELQVSASGLVKDLALFPDRLDPAARVDSGLVTLQAGQSHTFIVCARPGLDPAAWQTKPVLRSVNDLVGRTPTA
jgi:beta-mannosidase